MPDALSSAEVDRVLHALDRVPGVTSAGKRPQSNYAIRDLFNVLPEARRLAESDAVRSLVERVLHPNAFVVRGLLFDKTRDANWKVAWHQDLTIAVQQRVHVPGYGPWSIKGGRTHVLAPVGLLSRMLTVRLHLDDCVDGNGPLRVLPGSHLHGKLNSADIREWRAHVPAALCAVRRRGALLMRPLLLHASSPSLNPSHRRVIHLEFAAENLPGGLHWLT